MTPLEGIGDYIDINAVVNGWQALVIVVLVFAVMIWPGVVSMLNRRSMKAVEKSLTTNNGGSTTKDALDEIKGTLAEQNVTLANQGTKLDTHITRSDERAAEVAARLARLERKLGLFRR